MNTCCGSFWGGELKLSAAPGASGELEWGVLGEQELRDEAHRAALCLSPPCAASALMPFDPSFGKVIAVKLLSEGPSK